ncbi:hypothetical protein HPC49_11005 [Pyxidicoccus fallax]|uniref:Lipoprotein n=1 Tax=Pyxidicoccus fallax TaxID=394095 RepID=A0A848L727_9BACT|nr:hypothetical protein [Pyxidicoccus fallax]NMO14386.1 hypothetical protein [Pyxidicoccus fallax]NPC78768.1 hypothetical protein [Pyxidicoccus fallax]
MATHPDFRALLPLTSALAVTLLALPTSASAQEVLARRDEIPDAHLRGVTHVVCATFPEGSEPEVPLFERRGIGFQPASPVPRARTVPVSRWSDPGGWQEDCYPAFAHERVAEHGVSVQYAHVMLDLRSGRKAWLREGGDNSPTAVWVTIESLRPLEAFEDKGVEFFKLRREGQPPLVVREAPEDSASPTDLDLHDDSVILGRRVGDFAEVLVFDEKEDQYRRRGWVRLVDGQDTLLLWPVNYPSHGC